MPIYEYICKSCGAEYEELVISSEEKPPCPVCQSENVEKKISVVSMSGHPSGACTNFG